MGWFLLPPASRRPGHGRRGDRPGQSVARRRRCHRMQRPRRPRAGHPCSSRHLDGERDRTESHGRLQALFPRGRVWALRSGSGCQAACHLGGFGLAVSPLRSSPSLSLEGGQTRPSRGRQGGRRGSCTIRGCGAQRREHCRSWCGNCEGSQMGTGNIGGPFAKCVGA